MIVQASVPGLLELGFRRWRLLCGVFGTVVGLGILYLVAATPQFKSDAAVVVRFDQHVLPDTNLARDTEPTVSAQSERHEDVLTHADILKSPDVARQVIARIGLGTIFPKIAKKPWSASRKTYVALIMFKKALMVEPEEQGDVIDLSFFNPNASTARETLYELIRQYQTAAANVYGSRSVAFQQRQLDDARLELNVLSERLRAYKQTEKVVNLDAQLLALIKEHSDISENLATQEVALAEAVRHDQTLGQLIRAVPRNLQNTASGEKYRSVDDERSVLAGLVAKRNEMLTTYRPGDEAMLQLDAEIKTARAELGGRSSEMASRDGDAPNSVYQSIETDLLRADADASGDAQSTTVLRTRLAGIEKEIAHLEAARTQLDDLSRQEAIADARYRGLALHLADAQITANRIRDNISTGQVVVAPSIPIKPARPRYLILSVALPIAGAILAVGAVIARELSDNRLVTPSHLGYTSGLPIIGVFRAPTKERRTVRTWRGRRAGRRTLVSSLQAPEAS